MCLLSSKPYSGTGASNIIGRRRRTNIITMIIIIIININNDNNTVPGSSLLAAFQDAFTASQVMKFVFVV